MRRFTFTWDPAKAKANIRNHGISFETAKLAFNDPYLVQDLDRIVNGEMRWHTTGMVDGSLLLLVVHTTREKNGYEHIRIISARRAEKEEAANYYATNREYGLF